MRYSDFPEQSYYLGIPVQVINLPNEKGYFADPSSGYINARWPDGKVWTHWAAQLPDTPWGR